MVIQGLKTSTNRLFSSINKREKRNKESIRGTRMVRGYKLLAEIGKEDRFTAKEIEFLAKKSVRACISELTQGVSWVNLHELELKHVCKHANMLYHFKHKADFKYKDEAIKEAWHFGEYLHSTNLNDETALVLDVSSMVIDDDTIENIRTFRSVI